MADWRPMEPDDVPLVSAIATSVHPGLPEDDAVFAERQRLAPEGCWICEGDDGALGYVLSHPWTLDAPPALNSQLKALPARPDTFYIHDLALLPQGRGAGAAADIIGRLMRIGRSYPTMSLVAVNGSAPFWARFGFAAVDRPELAAKLLTYDRQARLMVRRG